jgi:cell division septal protein FtsQ
VNERVQVVFVTAVISLPMTIPRTPCSLENVIVSGNNLISESVLFV